MAILRIEPQVVNNNSSFTFNSVVATSNVSAAGYYWANGVALTTSLSFANASIAALDANVGAYQTYANSTFSTTSQLNTLNANIGAYQTYANTTTYSNANASAYLAATYPIVYDGALRIGAAGGPDLYLDAQNTIYVGHGGSNHTDLVVDAFPSFTGNVTFSGNSTISGAGNLTVNNLSNITVRSGGAIHLLSGAYLYGYDAFFSNLTISSNAAVGNISATGFYWANGIPFVSSTYGNAEVAAYLLVDSTITGLQSNAALQASLIDVLTGNAATQGSVLDVLVANAAAQSANLTSLLSNAAAQEASLTSLVSNAAAQSGAIDTINANVGAYQIYANANLATQTTNFNTLNANVGAYEIWANANLATQTTNFNNLDANVGAYEAWANANLATQTTNFNTLNANVGAYQIYANANAAIQATNIDSINANVGAYQIYANANAATQTISIDSINANVGAYQIYANANAAIQATNIDTLNANVGAYETWANAQIASKASIDSPTFTGNAVMANLTVGNIVVIGNSAIIGTTDLSVQDSIINLHTFANLAPLTVDDGRDIGIAFHYYKGDDNVAFLGWANDSGSLEYYAAGTETGGNVFAGSAYGTIKAGEFVSVNNTPSTSTSTGALRITGGAGIAGNLWVGGLTNIAGNLTTGNVAASGYFWANGTPFASSSYGNSDVAAYLSSYYTYANANAATQATGIDTINANLGSFQIWANTAYGTSSYANANVAAYLVSYTGNLAAGNITVTGNIVGGGVKTTTSATEPANPSPGDMWYDTTIDVLLRYTDLGTSRAWLDINGQTTAYTGSGNVGFGNVSATAYYFANGAPFSSSNYGNTEVAAYLTGNITTGNITTANVVTTNGVYWANGAAYSSGGGVTNTRSMIMTMVFGGL